jgi:hypothetical protein
MASPPGLSPRAWRILLLATLAGISAWLPFAAGQLGDYPFDAGPAVDALAGGHVGAFLGVHPDMGPVSILVRAPMVAVSGGGDLLSYRLGAIACLLAAGVLGLYLARLASERGASWIAQAALAGICLLNPLTFEALQTGHPEEVLTAALAVGAVAVAARGHGARAALLLGLAVASKQWAVIAVLPVLMALPGCRLRVAAGAAGVVAVLIVPGLLANPGDFLETQRSLAVHTQYVTPWNLWYPGSSATPFHLADAHMTLHPHYASGFVARFSHPAIVLAAVVLPLALAKRRRSFHLSGVEAMALLALLGLLRCVLDPVDNLYYHEPFLLALVGWDAFASRGLPVRGLAAAGAFELLSHWLLTSDVVIFNAVYLSLAGLAALAIALELFGRRDPEPGGERLGLDAAPGIAHPPLVRS